MIFLYIAMSSPHVYTRAGVPTETAKLPVFALVAERSVLGAGELGRGAFPTR